MSYRAAVYNVMIASPGDVAAERSIVREVLAEWNAVNSLTRGIVLLPVGWETHTSPEMGERPQAIINKQILQDCDLLVGVFWTRIGTATGEHLSGTVEEIEEHIKAGRPAMLYFASKPVELDSVDREQYEKLKKFRTSCESRGLLEKFSDLAEFKAKLYRQLQITLNTNPNFTGEKSESQVNIAPASAPTIPRLPREAQVLLKEMAQDPNGHLLNVRHMGGKTIQTNGKSLVEGNDPRQIALWDAALEELEEQGLIVAANYKREIFRVTRFGYDVADTLNP